MAPAKVLGIFGMSRDTREEDLREEFGRFGTLEDVVLIRDRRTGESKRFAFIYFTTVDEATKARDALNGTVRACAGRMGLTC